MLLDKNQTKRGESLTELAVLLSIVILAFLGIQTYLKRGLQARYKSSVDAATSLVSKVSNHSVLLQYEPLRQYEPYYRDETSIITTNQMNDSETMLTQGRKRLLIRESVISQTLNTFSRRGADFEEDDVWE